MLRSSWKTLCLLTISACNMPAGPEVGPSSTTTMVTAALVDPSVCPAGSNIIIGTPGPDVLVGTNGVDCILGDDGDDLLKGGNGADVIFGGDGNDVLVGGNGADILDGGKGNDLIVGDNGADTIRGGEGDDVIDSGLGDDPVSGGAGSDSCAGGAAAGCESPEQNITKCEADSDCAGGQRCASGVCISCLANAECDDGNLCTFESCQPALGCSNPNRPDGTLCLDSTVCNGTETCLSGTCTAGTPLVCASGYRCEAVPGCVNIDECAEASDNCDVNATCSDTPGSFSCACNLPDYEGDGVTCQRWCDPVVMGGGVERCVRARDDGTVSLHLTRDDRTAWEQQWVQADEPEVNYCGPTAGRNLLFWHGLDASYADLADQMNTNTWDTGAVVGAALVACAFEPICTTIVSVIVSDAVVKAGTIPSDMRAALNARRPAGFVTCVENGDADLDELRFSLSNGGPVVYLESRGEGNLHWAMVTGIFLEGGQHHLRIANSANRSWDDFKSDWTTHKVGGDVARALLDSLLGIRANIMIRWEREELATPLGGGLYGCP